MDLGRASKLVAAERRRIAGLLGSSEDARLDELAGEPDPGVGGSDGAQPLEHEAVDLAIATSLKERLAALDRAEKRIAAGTYGVSVESGHPIPDDRLEIDPAAERTVGEAAKHRHRDD